MTRNESINNAVITLSALLGIAVILLVIMGINNVNKSNQLSSIQSMYDNLTSSNAQHLQSCIKDAQNTAQIGLQDDSTGPIETAAVNSCKAEFPTE